MLGSYTSVLLRRAGLIVLLTALLAPLAFLLLTAGARTYESTAVVQTGSGLAAGVVGLDTPYEEPERRLATEIELFESDAVAERARQLLQEEGWTEFPQQLGENVSVSPRGVSNLLDVSGTDTDPERARQLTDAFVTAYVSFRQEVQRDTLEALVEDLEAQREVAEEELAAFDASDDLTQAAERERARAQSAYESLTSRVEAARLRLSVDTSGVALLSPASPAEPVEALGTAAAAALSLLGALMVACGMAFLLDLARDPVRTREEARALVPVAPLGELPRTRGARRGSMAALTDPSGPAAAGARTVRLRLEQLLGTTPRTLAVTAVPSDASDAVMVAASLAAEWGRTGLRVALVADPDHGLVELLNVPSAPQDQADTDAGPVHHGTATSLRGVRLLPRTTGTDGQAGWLDRGSPTAASGTFDVTILVNAGSGGMDTVADSSVTDATVVVCAVGRTPARRLESLLGTLGFYGVQVQGMVLTHRKAGRGASSKRKRPGRAGTGSSAARQGAAPERLPSSARGPVPSGRTTSGR